jgi:dTDP-4-amino-4,6-dideoxygalactose transaminase
MNGWPVFEDDEIEAATRVLRSGKVNYWTGGEGQAFEAEFATAMGSRHAIAVANGTLALDLAFEALALPHGTEVVVTPRTFVASVSSIVRAGLVPVCADVDLDSGNITPTSIARVLTPRTRAILCVHLGGWPCEMPAIMDFAWRHDLKVIEDCAQAHGATIEGRSVGSFGDIGAWSFCQDKIISTGGEGGMLTTDDDALFEAMWSAKDHGKHRLRARTPPAAPTSFRWLHDSLGTNARMTEPQAAIGRLQLRKLPAWQARRADIARAVLAACEGHPWLHVPRPDNRMRHAWYRAYVRLDVAGMPAGWDRDRLMFALQAAGVPCNAGSCSEVYREAAFAGTPLAATVAPAAAALTSSSLAFQVHPTLDDADVAAITSAIGHTLRTAVT